MVAEAWILKMGNQVSHNLKHALSLDHSRRKNNKKLEQKETIGILSFEVANVMSKTLHLHKSLTDQEVSKLKNEILKSEGVRNLVSSDESYLLELAVAEKLDDLNRVAAVVSRLGKRCTEPALQGFEHVYADIISGVIDVRELGFLVKDMEGMIRKMERYVTSTSNLYNEMEVLNELEQATKKFQNTQHEESRRAFEQKVIWQRQDVRHLKDVSLWNQTYNKIVGLLARTVCTIYARVCIVFRESLSRPGFSVLGTESSTGREGSSPAQDQSGQLSGQIDSRRHFKLISEPLQRASSKSNAHKSGPIEKVAGETKAATARPRLVSQRSEVFSFRDEDFIFPCGANPGKLFMECLSLSSSASMLDDDSEHDQDHNSSSSGYYSAGNGLRREHPYRFGFSGQVETGGALSRDQRQSKCSLPSRSIFGPNSRSMVYATPSTVGGSALALHYANVIIVIEKLLRYPHLVGEEARDDLYQMLPTSLRMSLRMNLKSYVKNLAIYDAPLAHDWKETLDKILKWLAPLAHNMIRWQTERNFEQQQIVTRTNVLLLQTLYFSDRGKTEAAICELLVGLNYICRYEHQQNALLDCASSFDFDDCVEWHVKQ
ncbi:protein PSK SIMULATOR 1 [Macadamia integrifolia]|uniref:protein PSK SIMULATOR 1 n=1 Tax=Macadamia integrifolia TaxID=60698 RepID=UPI001C4F6DAA|nr:protein PSK SIMULATOR 1 [Macadamia integrifolia]